MGILICRSENGLFWFFYEIQKILTGLQNQLNGHLDDFLTRISMKNGLFLIKSMNKNCF
jgi:hypothetical protein